MKKTLLTLIIAIAITFSSIAQIGIVDPNFNLGVGFGTDQWTGKCETIVQQSDGKLLVGGQFKSFNGKPAHYIARLNLNGTLDNDFVSQLNEAWGSQINQIKILPTGKILACGVYLKSKNIDLPGIVRLNSDGSIDSSFNAPTSITSCQTFDVQTDGKIVLGNLIRLNSNGSLDNTFNVGKGIAGGTGFGSVRVNKLVVQPDGKILIGGHFGSYDGNSSILLVRVNSDGKLDNTFNANTNFSPAVDGFYGQVYSLKLLPNGKIMIGGNYGNNNSLAFGVDRLNSDGSLDTSFKITHAFGIRNYALDVQTDGKVFAANVNFGAPSEAFVVERYHTDGSLDTIFPKKYVNNDVRDLIIQTDGNITFVGYFSYNPTGIMRLIGDTPSSAAVQENAPYTVSLYPNPCAEILHIRGVRANSTLRIVDLWGRTIVALNSLNNDLNTIDVRTLPEGTYMLQIEHKGIRLNNKFVIYH